MLFTSFGCSLPGCGIGRLVNSKVIGCFSGTSLATYVGSTQAGLTGAAAATPGITLFLVIAAAGYKKVYKKKLSPIMLIVIAAEMAVYGIS